MKKTLVFVLLLVGIILIPTYYSNSVKAQEITLEERNQLLDVVNKVEEVIKTEDYTSSDIQKLVGSVDKELWVKYAKENEYVAELLPLLEGSDISKEKLADYIGNIVEIELELFNNLMDTALTEDMKQYITEIVGQNAPINIEQVDFVANDMLKVLNTVIESESTAKLVDDVKGKVLESDLSTVINKVSELKESSAFEDFKTLIYDIMGKDTLDLSDSTTQEYIKLMTILSE